MCSKSSNPTGSKENSVIVFCLGKLVSRQIVQLISCCDLHWEVKKLEQTFFCSAGFPLAFVCFIFPEYESIL